MKVAIIQARMGSSRLPGKVLKEINGKPMLWHLINRVKLAKGLDEIVLAIPNTKENDKLEELAKELKIKCIRGSEKDVLSRYILAGKNTGADIIVMITGDCPLVCPEIIDETLKEFKERKCDYLFNDQKYSNFPRGFDVDIFYFEAIKKADKLAKDQKYREHSALFMAEHPEMFKTEVFMAKGNLARPGYRLCVDEEKDFELANKIFRHFAPREDFTAEEIIIFLDKNPKTAEINKNVSQKKY